MLTYESLWIKLHKVWLPGTYTDSARPELPMIVSFTRHIVPSDFPFNVTIADVSRHINRSDNLSSAVQPFCLPLRGWWTEFTKVYK